MTDDPLQEAARWGARLAEVLCDVGRRAGELAELVARDWPDPRGREWAERTSVLCSLLGREATTAAELGESYARQAADAPTPPLPATGGAGRRTGMRLGGTDAQRTDDERGMRIAELDPPPSG
ncbi:hypothetical protein FHX44_114299 [Pseudonocardia hierapolitana]|uniref:Excreted virulence factor EspC (Type VII ESX diderm) n=1 Tax=Pseudonocardia hierapolitana TaxID=1128676 RepID=A0A561SU80_9PSEU|nr:hypothetical protein [Pseudonocardia hierapolitana]TWF78376.1 hypothetical protein FHX44_114299 [Pseudonocardia hierapolitana]